jgi:alkylresorcinol/alkylpyrone synthase
MEPVRIVAAAVAHPANCVPQDEVAEYIGKLAGDPRRVAAMARATRIASRRTVLAPGQLATLGSIEERNAVYHGAAGKLAAEAVKAALGGGRYGEIGALVTTSCTGYSVPAWGVQLVEDLGLRCDTARLPITEAGCAGGVVAIARAADYVRAHCGQSAIAAAVELCSLSFHAGGGEGNLTSSLIFGDGAGAVVLEPGEGAGLEVLDSMSTLIPGTQSALGFDLTDMGFYPVLTRELVTLLPVPTVGAATRLLARNGLCVSDVGAWLLHPGGARILSGLERCLYVQRSATHWSWDSMREFGNTSSAAIFDVLRRYLAERPRGLAVVAAFGPGVSIELLLVRAAC